MEPNISGPNTNSPNTKMDKIKSIFSFAWLEKLRSRNAILALSLVFVLILVGVWAVFFNKSTAPIEDRIQEEAKIVEEIETAPILGAKVLLQEGVVEYSTNGLWDKAGETTELLPGMSIRTTGAASRAVVSLDDGSVIRLDANTQIEFETLTESRVVIHQESGYVYNRVAASNERDYIVRSTNAQYESQGTAFRTIVSGDEEAVETYQSSVKETRINISAEEGEKLIVVNRNNPEKNKSVQPMDIEQIKQDTFIMWNREQDAKDKNFQKTLGFLADIEGPKIDITEPAANGNVVVLDKGSTGTVEFKGTTEKGATLTVQSKSLSGSTPIKIELAEDGSFTSQAIEAPLGNSVFEFVAIDKVGNKTTLNVTLTLTAKATTQEEAIALTAELDETTNKIKLNWGLVGLTTPDGVKIVFSETAKPAYDDAPPTQKEFTKESKYQVDASGFASDSEWHFRVCRYNKTSDSCDVYSNDVVVVIP